jgi:mono/diheme cytochrome c family protein
MFFTYDIIKIEWPSFMEIQPSYGPMEEPLPVPVRSIPVEGPSYVPGAGAPENPVPADEASIARGATLFSINCRMCHGETGVGNGPVAGFLVNKKPADLTSERVQSKDDGTLFLIITNGLYNPNNSLFPEIEFSSAMPPLNENLTVADRWDLVNYIRTLEPPQQ